MCPYMQFGASQPTTQTAAGSRANRSACVQFLALLATWLRMVRRVSGVRQKRRSVVAFHAPADDVLAACLDDPRSESARRRDTRRSASGRAVRPQAADRLRHSSTLPRVVRSMRFAPKFSFDSSQQPVRPRPAAAIPAPQTAAAHLVDSPSRHEACPAPSGRVTSRTPIVDRVSDLLTYDLSHTPLSASDSRVRRSNSICLSADLPVDPDRHKVRVDLTAQQQ